MSAGGDMQLVVDTDTGIDDALALLWLAARPDVELVEVLSTHGNCSAEQAAANARSVLDRAGLGHVPVTGGRSAPLAGELSVAWFVHGHDGLGDCGLAPPPWPPAPPGSDAVTRLLDLADRHAGELDLLALGPLTNLGAALAEDPGVLRAFRTVTVMGGTGPRLGPGEPDPTFGVGDPNTYHDPEAARRVAAADAEVTLVGVDVTMGCMTGLDGLARLAATTTDHGRFADAICAFYVDFYEQNQGTRRLTLHDPLAAMVAAGAEVGATFRSGRCVVEGPAGAERAVLVDPRPGDRLTRAVAAASAEAATEELLLALEQPLPGHR
jgi:purine nucleosidase